MNINYITVHHTDDGHHLPCTTLHALLDSYIKRYNAIFKLIAHNPHKFTKRYKRSITWDFAMAAFSIIIYLTSPHEITQYLAISISAVFACIYFIRYKTQQLF